jgi:DNA repair protein RAD50
LEEDLKVIKQVNLEYYAEATGFTRTFEKVKAMNDEIEMREKNRKAMLQGMTVMNGELSPKWWLMIDTTAELEEKRKNFEKHLSSIQARKAKQIELREKEEEALEDLRRREGILSRTLGGLIARRDVSQVVLTMIGADQ